MAYCSDCNLEVKGAYCPQCGKKVGESDDSNPYAVGSQSLNTGFSGAALGEEIPSSLGCYVRFWKKYLDASGRASRTECWSVWIINAFVGVVLAMLGGAFIGASGGSEGAIAAMYVLVGIFALASFCPGVCLSIRRLHDFDQSGWLVLLLLIPYVSYIVSLIIALWPPTRGANRFGEQPRRR